MPTSASLVVCEIAKERLDQWVAQAPGPVSVATTAKAVAEQSVSWPPRRLKLYEKLSKSSQDVIFTMLPKGPHVWEVFTNPDTGLLSVEPDQLKDKLFIECSTIDVETSLRVAAKIEKLKAGEFADAPVSGGVNGAVKGTLSFMVGCPPEVFDRVKPVITLMGKPESIFHCGGASSGLATKQINNYLSCITMIGTCEAMNIGLRSGLDPTKLASVIGVSTGGCYNCGDQNPVSGVSPLASSARDFEGGFTTEMCKGVLDMALDHGAKVGAKSLVGDIVSDFYETAASHEKCKGKDFRSIWKLFYENEGKDLPGK